MICPFSKMKCVENQCALAIQRLSEDKGFAACSLQLIGEKVVSDFLNDNLLKTKEQLLKL